VSEREREREREREKKTVKKERERKNNQELSAYLSYLGVQNVCERDKERVCVCV
jgi:hypothetical protein